MPELTASRSAAIAPYSGWVTGRKRRWSHIRYEPLHWTNCGETYSNEILIEEGIVRPFKQTLTEQWRRQAGRFPNQPKSFLYHPAKNGWNDPLTIAMVLDALLRVEPTSYVSAVQLTGLMVQQYRMCCWDQHTLGKVLSDLHAWAQLTKRYPNAPAPLEKVTWNGARQYVLDANVQGWHWLGLLREHFGKLAAEAVAFELETQTYPPRSDSVWDGIADLTWGEAPA